MVQPKVHYFSKLFYYHHQSNISHRQSSSPITTPVAKKSKKSTIFPKSSIFTDDIPNLAVPNKQNNSDSTTGKDINIPLSAIQKLQRLSKKEQNEKTKSVNISFNPLPNRDNEDNVNEQTASIINLILRF
ncbi:11993_t:CDS:2 [Ambispora gerdemannii]|uniref:11993_t:CDS:1 n=1 Tax=Ambispora gerdemannii TaxID=144530 RepID=A0A9N8Z4C5_9GLOM|nr:11993_t:CDS:2 [Ambispora gerdemannii]